MEGKLVCCKNDGGDNEPCDSQEATVGSVTKSPQEHQRAMKVVCDNSNRRLCYWGFRNCGRDAETIQMPIDSLQRLRRGSNSHLIIDRWTLTNIKKAEFERRQREKAGMAVLYHAYKPFAAHLSPWKSREREFSQTSAATPATLKEFHTTTRPSTATFIRP